MVSLSTTVRSRGTLICPPRIVTFNIVLPKCNWLSFPIASDCARPKVMMRLHAVSLDLDSKSKLLRQMVRRFLRDAGRTFFYLFTPPSGLGLAEQSIRQNSYFRGNVSHSTPGEYFNITVFKERYNRQFGLWPKLLHRLESK